MTHPDCFLHFFNGYLKSQVISLKANTVKIDQGHKEIILRMYDSL